MRLVGLGFALLVLCAHGVAASDRVVSVQSTRHALEPVPGPSSAGLAAAVRSVVELAERMAEEHSNDGERGGAALDAMVSCAEPIAHALQGQFPTTAVVEQCKQRAMDTFFAFSSAMAPNITHATSQLTPFLQPPTSFLDTSTEDVHGHDAKYVQPMVKGTTSDAAPNGGGSTVFMATKLWFVIPALVLSLGLFGLAFLLRHTHAGYSTESECEVLFMRHDKKFDNFWKAVALEPTATQKRWVHEMCMLAGDYTPKPALDSLTARTWQPTIRVDEIHESEDEVKEVEKALKPHTMNAEPGAVPVSLNGHVPPSLQSARSSDFLQDQLNSLFRLYTSSGGAVSLLETSATVLADGNDVVAEALGEGDEIQQAKGNDHGDPSSHQELAAVEKGARACWERLGNKVLSIRDVRNWRTLVSKALKAVAVTCVLYGVASTLFSTYLIIDSKRTECDFNLLDPLRRIGCNNAAPHVCRLSCSQSGDFEYQMCAVGTDHNRWVTMLHCP